MVNTFRYKIYKESTENAIRRYSEAHYAASWFMNIENEVYSHIVNNTPFIHQFFTYHEICYMRDLIREGLWVKWINGEVLLTRNKPQQEEYFDYDTCVNGAD